MHDRYLFAGAGGDQLTGRVLCGLPFNDASFATLPPHFDGDLARIPWLAVLPPYPRLPQTFKRALSNLLASICYHETWLRSTLPAHHPLCATYLFASGEVTRLKLWVVAGRNHCPLTGMQATGIPPHLVMSNELTDVARQTELMKGALLIDDIKTLLNSAVNQMRTELRDAIPTAATVSAPLAQITDADADPRFQLWLWKGRMNMVPETWKFPKTDVKAIWNLWHYGHVEEKIRPLRHLKKADLQGSAQITLWSKANGVMGAIAATMVEMKAVEAVEAVTKLSANASAEGYDAAIVQLMEKVKPGVTRGSSRWNEVSVGTLYNHLKVMRGQRKRKRDEQQQPAGQTGEVEEVENNGG